MRHGPTPAVTARPIELGWIEYGPSKRGVRVTEPGEDGLAATFGYSPQS